MIDNKPVYLCDPEKNKLCDKSECYISGGTCSHTFNKAYEKKQTNQNKLAEMVRTMSPKVLAKMIFEGNFEPIFNCDDCPAKYYCDERMKYNENDPEFVTCEMVMNEWLIKED